MVKLAVRERKAPLFGLKVLAYLQRRQHVRDVWRGRGLAKGHMLKGGGAARE